MKKTSYLEKMIALNPLTPELDLMDDKNPQFNTDNQLQEK